MASTDYHYSLNNGVLRITEKGKTIKELTAVAWDYTDSVLGAHDTIREEYLSPIKGTPFTERIMLIVGKSKDLMSEVLGIVKRGYSTNPFDTTYKQEKYGTIIRRYKNTKEFAIFDETALWQPGYICVKPHAKDEQLLVSAINYQGQKYKKLEELKELDDGFKSALALFKMKNSRSTTHHKPIENMKNKVPPAFS
ncbi:MAG: hypothetical protein NT051_05880 [Candidatus Micrarchaeota archaeon]|nr:hypothetical protein [Candidatus Micrarchaeota archaeon]